jgi:hypothetical protein
MSRAAVGCSNHLSSRYRGSFLETKKPGREANHAPPPSAMLEMCVHIPPPHTHTSHAMLFSVKHRGMYFSYLVWKRIQIVGSACQCVRNKSSSNSHSTGTCKIGYVRSAIQMHRLLPIFLVAMALVLILYRSLEQNSVLWDWLSWLRFVVVFSALSYEYSRYCIKSIHGFYSLGYRWRRTWICHLQYDV